MNISREIDVSSLLSSSEPFREFVIDPDAQVIFPRPHPTGLYSLWVRFVAWFCRGNTDREAYAIHNGYLPLTFNGAHGFDAKYLIEGLRNSLCDLPGFDSDVFDNAAIRLRVGLGNPQKSPVALAKRLVERIRGMSCDDDTMKAIRDLVPRWLDGPRAKELGFDRSYKQKLIRHAIFSTNSEALSGVDMPPETLAQRALDATISSIIENRNKKNLLNRISALAGDASSPHLQSTKARIEALVLARLQESSPSVPKSGDVLDHAVANAYVEARAELLTEQLGIDPAWARKIAQDSLDLKTIGSVTLPYIPAFPSEKEADALLGKHHRDELLAACCVVARRKLKAERDPTEHVGDQSERERRNIILAAELDTAVMVVRPNWADQEAVLLSAQAAAKKSNVELVKCLLAHRNDSARVAMLDNALRFEKLSAQAGIAFEAQRRITAKLHVNGLLPVESVERFGAAARAAADLLALCATAPRGESSGQIFTALCKTHKAISQLLASASAAMSAEQHQAVVQAMMQVAVIGLVRQHRGTPLLAQIVRAFASTKADNRTQSIWRALRSSDLARKPLARELDRLLSMLIVEFGSELQKAEHRVHSRVGHGASMTKVAAEMHAAIDHAFKVKGTKLTLIRADLGNALREKL